MWSELGHCIVGYIHGWNVLELNSGSVCRGHQMKEAVGLTNC